MGERDPSDPGDEDRDAILRRRQRLIALALAGASSIATGCSDAGPTPCLEPAIDSGRQDAGIDGGRDTPLDACLSVRPDSGSPDAGETGEPDSGMVVPMPCLSMAPPDSGPSKK